MKLLLVAGLLALSAASPQQARRRGRQSAPGRDYLAPADAAYGAPADEGYGAPSEAADEGYGAPEVEEVAAPSELDNSYLAPAASAPEEALDSYGAADEELSGYGALDAAASDEVGDMGLKMLMTSVPGVPGEDYPIYAEVPESAFSCEGQVEGGYYADEEAECQVFHICAAEEAKYSFLCPNGTIFNQEYFICDWWFNVDCAESASIAEAKNSELAATREAASAAAAEAAASDAVDSYAAPEGGYLAPDSADSGSGLSGYQAEYSRRS
jgi:hypothetical protein